MKGSKFLSFFQEILILGKFREGNNDFLGLFGVIFLFILGIIIEYLIVLFEGKENIEESQRREDTGFEGLF